MNMSQKTFCYSLKVLVIINIHLYSIVLIVQVTNLDSEHENSSECFCGVGRPPSPPAVLFTHDQHYVRLMRCILCHIFTYSHYSESYLMHKLYREHRIPCSREHFNLPLMYNFRNIISHLIYNRDIVFGKIT